jgi:hypothetical protein
MKTTTIPTEEEINAIPSDNWIAWLKAEYNHSCGEPGNISITTKKEEMDEEHQDNDYMITFKTFCSGLNQTYCDVTPEQYEKIKSGFYNRQIKKGTSDFKKMIEFMGYESRYPENKRDKDRIFFKQVGKGESGEEWIWLDSGPDVSFRPDINWKHINKVVDYIESLPSTLMTSIEYIDSDRHKYTFKILMKEGVASSGLNPGFSKESKIDAVYNGVMNYINWRKEVENG